MKNLNFNLPDSTLFDRRVPKQKFYENLPITAALKRSFIDEIVSIRWRNKLAASTLNLQPGATVSEIQVFEIELTGERLNEDVLRQMDSCLPYHLLFVLSNAGRVSAWIGYKEAATADGKAFTVNKYYHTEWMPEHELNLKIEGLNMDAVWENFIIQVGGVEIGQGKSLAEQIQIDDQKEKLQKEIEKLEKQAWNEKQPNKKFEMTRQIKKLRVQLETYR